MHLTVRREIFVGHLSQQENSPVEVNPQPPYLYQLPLHQKKETKQSFAFSGTGY